MNAQEFYAQKVHEELHDWLVWIVYNGDGSFASDRVEAGLEMIIELMGRAFDEGLEFAEKFGSTDLYENPNPYKEHE